MSNIIDYMEEMNLTNSNLIQDYFFKTEINVILSFVEYIQDLAYEDWSIANYSPYSFVPSLDTAGFGGCVEASCRIKRASSFCKFASLYCDTIYLFVDSITLPHSINLTEELESQYRYKLFCDFSLINTYSNLIKNGIARIIPPHFNLCPDCFAKQICSKQEMELLNPLIKEYSAKAVIEAIDYNFSENCGCIAIRNLPELFPDHDGYVLITEKEGGNLLKSLSNFPQEICDHDWKKKIIESRIYDNYFSTKFETFMSSAYHSKYITSNKTNKTVIDSIQKSTIGSTPAPMFEMPFLENVDTELILKIRESEYHAFNDYRIALDKAIQAYSKEPSSNSAKAIYDDIVYPAFVQMDKAFDRAKTMRAFKAISEFVVISSTVTLGYISSIIPPNPAGVLASIGGTSVITKLLGDIVERKIIDKNELKSNDFYFLWKLNNQSNRTHI